MPSRVQIGAHPQRFALFLVHIELSGSDKLAEVTKGKLSLA